MKKGVMFEWEEALAMRSESLMHCTSPCRYVLSVSFIWKVPRILQHEYEMTMKVARG